MGDLVYNVRYWSLLVDYMYGRELGGTVYP
jgi:hypothetical protein